MAKSANLYARIEPDIKEQAETIFLHLVFLPPMRLPCSISKSFFKKGFPLK